MRHIVRVHHHQVKVERAAKVKFLAMLLEARLTFLIPQLSLGEGIGDECGITSINPSCGGEILWRDADAGVVGPLARGFENRIRTAFKFVTFTVMYSLVPPVSVKAIPGVFRL